jgi:hypothetical protein
VRVSSSAAHSHSMAQSKAATLLDRSRRKLKISVAMLMMPPMQECFVPLGQNHQWDFRTMLAVLRCEFLRERAGSATPRCSSVLITYNSLKYYCLQRLTARFSMSAARFGEALRTTFYI